MSICDSFRAFQRQDDFARAIYADRFDRALEFSWNYPADPNRTFATPEEKIALDRILAHDQDYPCPFCKSCPCEHWNGTGWINPNFQSANVGKPQPVETPEKSAKTKDDGREDDLEMERRLA